MVVTWKYTALKIHPVVTLKIYAFYYLYVILQYKKTKKNILKALKNWIHVYIEM